MLTVEGTYTSGDRQGITVSHEIDFGTMQIKRNYLYKVRIALEDPAGDTYGTVTHAINVKDWTSGVTLAWAGDENLYNNLAAANFTVSGTERKMWDADGVKLERHLVLPYNAEKSATFYVTSTSTKSGLNLTCPATALAATEEGGGYQCIIGVPEMIYSESGQFTQRWPVTVRQSAFDGGTVLKFTLQNALNSALSASFEVVGIQPNKPTFTMLAQGATGSSTSKNILAENNSNNNPSVIYCRPTDGKITLEVKTKGGAILAIDDDSQWTESGSSVTLSGYTYDTDGETMIQNITFQLSATRGKKNKFTLKNAVDPTDESLWRTFTVDVFKTPVEYMATGSVKHIAQQSGYWVLDKDVHTYSTAYFSWPDASSYFGIDNGTGINPNDVLCRYSDGTGEGYYHMPTLYEWYGIISSDNYSIFSMPTSTPREETDPKVVISTAKLANCKSQYLKSTSETQTVYILKCMNDPVYGNLFRYAARIKYIESTADNNKLRRYQYESIYIGEDNSITSVNNVLSSYWTSNSSKIVTRTLPTVSYSTIGTTNNKGTGGQAPSSPGYYSTYATSTKYDNTDSWIISMPVGPTTNASHNTTPRWGEGQTTNGVAVRLWSNE